MKIAWDREKLADLKAQRDEAIAKRESPFQFVEREGSGYLRREVARHPMTVSAAHQIVSYLEEEFGRVPDRPALPHNEGGEGQ